MGTHTVSPGEAVTVLMFVGSIVLAVGRSLWLTAKIEKKVEQIEKDFAEHMKSNTLHRTPDFEQLVSDLKDDLRAINQKLDTLIYDRGKK